MIKFGVVIPTYKRADLVTRAIDSVLNQSYQNFVICVVEDCSPDNTKEVIHNRYINNENVHYIRLETNQGVNVARNTALDYLLSDEVACDYITMLDDDDYFTTFTFQKAFEALKKESCKWLVFNRIDSKGNKITKCNKYLNYYDYLYDYFIDDKIIGDTNMFIKSSLIDNIRFNQNLLAHEYLFFIELSMHSSLYIVDFNAVVCEYLANGLTDTINKKVLNEEEKNILTSEENKIFNKLGHTVQTINCLKIKNNLLKSLKQINIERIIRYLFKLFSCYSLKKEKK